MSGRHLHAVDSPARTWAEIVAERFRVIDEFTAKYGADWWDHHDAPPDDAENVQLDLLGSEAA